MVFKNSAKGVFIGLAVMLSMAASPGLQAQGYDSYETQSTAGALSQSGGQQDYPQDTLKKYVDASQSVQQVAQQYQGQMTRTQDPEKMQQLQQEASQQMTRAVRETGMEVPEYNEISQQLRQDPELHERVLELQNS